jgi:hypothetical protein
MVPPATATLALLLSAPTPAWAQRGAFVDSLIEFHSALFGTYGDESQSSHATPVPIESRR